MRCWPGGLCLSRSIGDVDVGEFIVPVPYVKQVKVCSSFFDTCILCLRHGSVFLYHLLSLYLLLIMIHNLQLSTGGGRVIISSDGVWDALSTEVALDCCRGMPAEAAAAQIVKVCCY